MTLDVVLLDKWDKEIDSLEKELDELLKLRESIKNNPLIQKKDNSVPITPPASTLEKINNDFANVFNEVLFDQEDIKVEQIKWNIFKISNNTDYQIGVETVMYRNYDLVESEWFYLKDLIEPNDFGFAKLKSWITNGVNYELKAGDVLEGDIIFRKYAIKGNYENFDFLNDKIKWKTKIVIQHNVD